MKSGVCGRNATPRKAHWCLRALRPPGALEHKLPPCRKYGERWSSRSRAGSLQTCSGKAGATRNTTQCVKVNFTIMNNTLGTLREDGKNPQTIQIGAEFYDSSTGVCARRVFYHTLANGYQGLPWNGLTPWRCGCCLEDKPEAESKNEVRASI